MRIVILGTQKLQTLNKGDVFKWMGNYYIKCGFTDQDKSILAFSFKDNEMREFGLDTNVKIVDAELHILNE